MTRDNSDEYVLRTCLGAIVKIIDQVERNCAWEITTPGEHLLRMDDSTRHLRMELATGEHGQLILCDPAGLHIKIGDQFELDFNQANGKI